METPASLSCTSNLTLVVLNPTQEEVALKNIFLSGIDKMLSTAFRSIILKSEASFIFTFVALVIMP